MNPPGTDDDKTGKKFVTFALFATCVEVCLVYTNSTMLSANARRPVRLNKCRAFIVMRHIVVQFARATLKCGQQGKNHLAAHKVEGTQHDLRQISVTHCWLQSGKCGTYELCVTSIWKGKRAISVEWTPWSVDSMNDTNQFMAFTVLFCNFERKNCEMTLFDGKKIKWKGLHWQWFASLEIPDPG